MTMGFECLYAAVTRAHSMLVDGRPSRKRSIARRGAGWTSWAIQLPTLTWLIVAACCLSTAATSRAAEHDDVQAQALADRAVQMLTRGEAHAVAATLMLYPATYTPEQRKDDVASTGDGLSLLAQEFGGIAAAKVCAKTTDFYEIGGSGGDAAYAASLVPHYSAQILYEATFAKLGAGYLRVAIVQLASDGPLEIRGIYFGLPISNPRAKETLVAITRKELEQMKVPLTPEIERQIREALTPVRYPI